MTVVRYMTNFKDTFEKKIIKMLQEKLKIKNPMAVPKLVKIVINSSSREFLQDKKSLEKVREDLTLISGQKPKMAKAHKSIASFKLREGDAIGLTLTLRGKRMYDFFEKLVRIVFPRVKDFSGISDNALDGHGNITIGFSEHTVFSEIDPGKVDKIRSLEVTLVTNAKDNKTAKALFEAMGMPFKKGVSS